MNKWLPDTIPQEPSTIPLVPSAVVEELSELDDSKLFRSPLLSTHVEEVLVELDESKLLQDEDRDETDHFLLEISAPKITGVSPQQVLLHFV